MTSLQRKMLIRLEKLKPGTTMCPGKLSRDCGWSLAKARGDLLQLAREKKVFLSQRNKDISPDDFKGPFRVRGR